MTWSEQAEAPVAKVFLVLCMPATQWQERLRILCGVSAKIGGELWCMTQWPNAAYCNPFPTAGCAREWRQEKQSDTQFLAWIVVMNNGFSGCRIFAGEWEVSPSALLVTKIIKIPTCNMHLSQTMISLMTRWRGTSWIEWCARTFCWGFYVRRMAL